MRSLHYRSRCLRSALIGALPFLFFGCGSVYDPGGYACTTQFVYGIRATAKNAQTGADITSGSYIKITEGSYTDSVPSQGSLLLTAGERAGTYTVTIGRAGYSAFTASNVKVDKDQCHVIPVVLEALLQPAP